MNSITSLWREPSEIAVDCEWTTGLGVCFYDRVSETMQLADLMDQYSTIVLIGPRNVGKSELARYTLRRVKRVNPLVIDARAKSLLLADRLVDAADIVRRVEEVIAERLGLKPIVDLALDIAAALRADKFLLVDEAHLLARYPLEELESLSKVIAFYPKYRGWKLVVTISEGFVVAHGLWDRLEGYSARIYVVNPLDENHMRELYREYRSRHGCILGEDTYLKLVGGVPGYLAHLCPLKETELKEWLAGRLAALEEAIMESPLPFEDALRRAYRILVEGREAITREDYVVARNLVERNIAYPLSRRRFAPQLRLYTAALAHYAERRSLPAASELLEAAMRG